jgi:DNA mismatch endonuclease (patch repair protein)
MADVFDKAKRSEVMSRIRGRGNRDTELALMRLLREHRITGWRRHQDIPGRPDFVFRAARVTVFVDGCFWHGCPKHCQLPATNRIFWKRKLGANKERDRQVTSSLRASGWAVIRIWECQLAKAPGRCVRRIRTVLEGRR